MDEELKKPKSATGLDKNVASALSYVLGPISGVVFLVLEKDPKVKFHAMQSIVVFGLLLVAQMIMGVSVIFIPLVPLLSILIFVLWLVLVYRAWKGEDWEVPVLGEYAKKWVKKV